MFINFNYIIIKLSKSNFLFPFIIVFMTFLTPFFILIIFISINFALLLYNLCKIYIKLNKNKNINKNLIPIYSLEQYNNLTGNILIINPNNEPCLGIPI